MRRTQSVLGCIPTQSEGTISIGSQNWVVCLSLCAAGRLLGLTIA
jgi:hypothetical protein